MATLNDAAKEVVRDTHQNSRVPHGQSQVGVLLPTALGMRKDSLPGPKRPASALAEAAQQETGDSQE